MSNKIQFKYEQKCSEKSDINELLPTIKKYAEKCSHITEFGVREVVSTWALLAANPKKLISYDIYTSNNINEVIELTKEANIEFEFIESSDLEIVIEDTELLFIDTLHNYEQLKEELRLHAKNVQKYIILHDTSSFYHRGETSEKGLGPALEEFLANNNEWQIHEVLTNNNGLTVLKRKI